MMSSDVTKLKQRVCAAIDRRTTELIETADWIHAHPEIGHQEVEASKRLAGMLRQDGIPVEMGTAGMATAFKAELGGQNGPRPRVAILAEYDALPGLGHGCGHNLIGTSAIGAGLALNEVAPETLTLALRVIDPDEMRALLATAGFSSVQDVDLGEMRGWIARP